MSATVPKAVRKEKAELLEGFTVRARIQSFGHAFRGIGELVRSQHNAWIHAAATVAALGLGLLLGLTRGEWIAIVFAVALVWIAEALNTAFEALCDVVSPEFHPGVKRAKDVAAGAVLIAAIASAVIGALVFVPRIAEFFS